MACALAQRLRRDRSGLPSVIRGGAARASRSESLPWIRGDRSHRHRALASYLTNETASEMCTQTAPLLPQTLLDCAQTGGCRGEGYPSTNMTLRRDALGGGKGLEQLHAEPAPQRKPADTKRTRN